MPETCSVQVTNDAFSNIYLKILLCSSVLDLLFRLNMSNLSFLVGCSQNYILSTLILLSFMLVKANEIISAYKKFERLMT